MSKIKERQGFEWIPSKSEHPYVTIDRNNRLYISKPARELLKVPDGSFYLQIGFDSGTRRIGLARPYTSPDLPTPFKFDKRAYSKAKHFVERARLRDVLPCRFLYLGLGEEVDADLYPPGVHIFELEDHVSFDA